MGHLGWSLGPNGCIQLYYDDLGKLKDQAYICNMVTQRRTNAAGNHGVEDTCTAVVRPRSAFLACTLPYTNVAKMLVEHSSSDLLAEAIEQYFCTIQDKAYRGTHVQTGSVERISKLLISCKSGCGNLQWQAQSNVIAKFWPWSIDALKDMSNSIICFAAHHPSQCCKGYTLVSLKIRYTFRYMPIGTFLLTCTGASSLKQVHYPKMSQECRSGWAELQSLFRFCLSWGFRQGTLMI